MIVRHYIDTATGMALPSTDGPKPPNSTEVPIQGAVGSVWDGTAYVSQPSVDIPVIEASITKRDLIKAIAGDAASIIKISDAEAAIVLLEAGA